MHSSMLRAWLRSPLRSSGDVMAGNCPVFVVTTKSVSTVQKASLTWAAANQARKIILEFMLALGACRAGVLTWLWWSMYWHFWPREIGGEKVEEKTGSWGCKWGGKVRNRKGREEVHEQTRMDRLTRGGIQRQEVQGQKLEVPYKGSPRSSKVICLCFFSS